jgi:hypothetical protein
MSTEAKDIPCNLVLHWHYLYCIVAMAAAWPTAKHDHLHIAQESAALATFQAFRAAPQNAPALSGIDAAAAEEVIYSDSLVKINRLGMRQQRTLVITTIAIYNFKPKSYAAFQRRIKLFNLERVVLISGTNELGKG